MINVELTEEFIDKHYFTLTVPYSVEKYDADGFPTDEWTDIEAETEWEITDDSYIGGDIHLDGLTLNMWLEIPEEDFKKIFTAHEWLKRKAN